MKLLALAASLWLVCSSVAAQPDGATTLFGKALILQANNKLTCGVQLHFVGAPGQPGDRVLSVDSVIELDLANDTTVLQFMASDYRFHANDVAATVQSTRAIPVTAGWMRIEPAAVPRSVASQVTEIEPVSGLRYALPLAAGMPVMKAILAGQAIEVGVRLKHRLGNTAREGVVYMRLDDRQRVQSCLDVTGDSRRK